MVGARGFEPPTSASRTQRSSQAEPRSDIKYPNYQRYWAINVIAHFKKTTIKIVYNRYFLIEIITFFNAPSPSLAVVISVSS